VFCPRAQQSLVPAPFEFVGHQAMVGIGLVVLLLGASCAVACRFEGALQGGHGNLRLSDGHICRLGLNRAAFGIGVVLVSCLLFVQLRPTISSFVLIVDKLRIVNAS
jgi:hypothetical protein